MDIGEADVENGVELKILGVVSPPIYHRVALGPMNDMRGLHVNVPEDEDMTQQWVFMGSRTFIYESRNEHSVDIYDWTVRDAHTENIGDFVYRSRVESYCKNSAILVCWSSRSSMRKTCRADGILTAMSAAMDITRRQHWIPPDILIDRSSPPQIPVPVPSKLAVLPRSPVR